MSNPKQAPLLTGEDVFALLPQDDPIQMVDTLWSNSDTSTVSGFTITEDNIFVQEGEFMEPGIIENIAQTAALRLGYRNLSEANSQEGIEPNIGFIGAVKKLKIYKLPCTGDVLKTKIEEVGRVFNITAIHGAAFY